MSATGTRVTRAPEFKHKFTQEGGTLTMDGQSVAIPSELLPLLAARYVRNCLNVDSAEIRNDNPEAVRSLIDSTLKAIADGSYFKRDTSGARDKFITVLAEALFNSDKAAASTFWEGKEKSLSEENLTKLEGQVRRHETFAKIWEAKYPRKERAKSTKSLTELLA